MKTIRIGVASNEEIRSRRPDKKLLKTSEGTNQFPFMPGEYHSFWSNPEGFAITQKLVRKAYLIRAHSSCE